MPRPPVSMDPRDYAYPKDVFAMPQMQAMLCHMQQHAMMTALHSLLTGMHPMGMFPAPFAHGEG
jgi:hypothetical protein